ncbi:MAG: TraR/DksA C4-type zinc finger protein [Caldilineales bacterium]|nr:TraR/DksA C4-type zinc finger protein [Caldilineales bacterium]
MTRDDARLRRLLEEEQTKLLADIAYFSSLEYRNSGTSNHMADDASEAYDQASDLTLRLQAEHRLKRIERALTKFEQNRYGFCEACGEPIDFARLKALPDARFCLSCQRKRETRGGPKTGPRAFEGRRIDTPSLDNGS